MTSINNNLSIKTLYIKNIIFDFDGVIADTLEIKAEAFQKIYKEAYILCRLLNLYQFLKNY